MLHGRSSLHALSYSCRHWIVVVAHSRCALTPSAYHTQYSLFKGTRRSTPIHSETFNEKLLPRSWKRCLTHNASSNPPPSRYCSHSCRGTPYRPQICLPTIGPQDRMSQFTLITGSLYNLFTKKIIHPQLPIHCKIENYLKQNPSVLAKNGSLLTKL